MPLFSGASPAIDKYGFGAFSHKIITRINGDLSLTGFSGTPMQTATEKCFVLNWYNLEWKEWKPCREIRLQTIISKMKNIYTKQMERD